MKKYLMSFFVTCLFLAALPTILLGEERESIKIGALMALTGQFAMQGNAFTEGVGLAVNEVNERGGINGKKLIVVIEDSHGDPKAAHTSATKLKDIDKVIAGITCSYPETKVGGGEFQKSKIPSIALWDSSPEIDDMGDYIFSIGPWVLSSGEKAADYSSVTLKAKTAVIINTVEEWSELVPNYFQSTFEKQGGKILGRFRVNPEDSDFKTILTKTKSLNPDVIYAPLTHNIVPFHRQVKTLKLNKPIVSSDIISDEHLQQASKELEGVYQTNVKDPENELANKLLTQYKSKYDKDVTLPWFVATGYDAVMILAHAIEIAGTDGPLIKDELYKIQNFPGAAQLITIDLSRNSF